MDKSLLIARWQLASRTNPRPVGEFVEFPVAAYLLDRPEGRILFDAGCHPQAMGPEGRWPQEFQDKLMTLNLHGRRVNVDRLEREGSGFVGRHDPDILKAADPWPEFRKMFALKRFPQVWVSASEPYELSLTKEFPYRDTMPFFKATYEEFGPKQLIWGTGYPKPRWELPMDKELEFVEMLDFYKPADRDDILGRNALRIWKFPKG